MINGIITNKEIWANKVLIITYFGFGFFIKCLWIMTITNKNTTFLALVMEYNK